MDNNINYKIHDLIDLILIEAKKIGASSSEITVNFSNGFSVNVRKGEIDFIEKNQCKNFLIKLYFGNNSGFVSTSNLDEKSIRFLLEKAKYIAKFTEKDKCNGLADKSLMAKNYPNLKLSYSWDLQIMDAVNIAKSCESIALGYDKRIVNSEGVEINTTNNINFYANSHEFYGEISHTIHSICCSLVSKDKEQMHRDYYYSVARNPKCLEDFAIVATKAAKKTINRLGSKKINTKKCPIIFSADVATSLINDFLKAINGYNVYQKSSFLSDELNKQIFSNKINIVEDPYILEAIGSKPFDGEGVKLFKTDIISNGILQRYMLDSYSGRKLNLLTTGNAGGAHNIIVKTSNLSLIDLFKKIGSGVFVTELVGGGVNIINGDYSRGIFGYWINNGEIQYPITGATIAGNLKNIFLGIQEISNDVDNRSHILTGSILIDEMVVAGN